MLRRTLMAGAAGVLAAPAILRAQGAMPKITIGMSGWTGFAPLLRPSRPGCSPPTASRWKPSSSRSANATWR